MSIRKENGIVIINNEKEMLDYIDKYNPTTEQFIEYFSTKYDWVDVSYCLIRLGLERKIQKIAERYYLKKL